MDANPYDVLEVDEDATQAEIKSAFRSRAMKCHPDQADNLDQEEAKRKFIRVRKAFELIGDPESRKEFDRDSSSYTTGSNRRSSRRRSTGNTTSQRETKDSYDEEWRDFNKNPEVTVGEVIESVAGAFTRAAKEGLNLWAKAFGFGTKYGLPAGAVTGIVLYTVTESPYDTNPSIEAILQVMHAVTTLGLPLVVAFVLAFAGSLVYYARNS